MNYTVAAYIIGMVLILGYAAFLTGMLSGKRRANSAKQPTAAPPQL